MSDKQCIHTHTPTLHTQQMMASTWLGDHQGRPFAPTLAYGALSSSTYLLDKSFNSQGHNQRKHRSRHKEHRARHHFTLYDVIFTNANCYCAV